MPDDFQPKPEWNYFDHSPQDEAVPVAGISDAPAHIAIVNQEWVAFLLGAIDRLGYGDNWAGSDNDRENAHHAILELEALLMSPANLLVPFDVFDENYSTSSAPSGNLTLQILEVPEGEVWKVESATIVYGGATMPSRIRLFHSTNPSLRHIIYQTSVQANVLYTNNSPIWIAGKTWIFLASDNTVNPTTILVSISGLRFKAT